MSSFWTASRISTTRRCLRLAHYRYDLHVSEASSDTARFGTVGHNALEVGLLHYEADAEVRLEMSLATCGTLPDRYEVARVRAVVIGYWARWGSTAWTVLAVEVEFAYMLGDVEIRGKIDAIIRDDEDGRIYVVEHKFTSMDASPGSTYWERLTIDTQISIYTDGAKVLGYEIAGVIYDVSQKPQHKPAMATPEAERKYTVEKNTAGKGCKSCGGRAGGKDGPKQGTGKAVLDDADAGDALLIMMGDDRKCPACDGTGWAESPKHEPSRLYATQRDTDEDPADFEARVLEAITANPDGFYRRAVIVRLDDELPKMRQDTLDTVKLWAVSELFELWPRNPGACGSFGSLCFFFDACAGRVDIHDLARFPRGKAHPELAATNP